MTLGALLTLAVVADPAASATLATAERLAEQARNRCVSAPAEGLKDAERALSLTAEFAPTQFVQPGRKGELIEDAFLSARAAYRRHRARLYHAAGECLLQARRDASAVRYLRRALDLDPQEGRRSLGEALLKANQARAALDILLAEAELAPQDLVIAGAAADALGLASLQSEIDRARINDLNSPAVAFHDGPFRLPPSARLSTGAPFRLASAHGPILVYVSDAMGRHCTADLEQIRRATARDAQVVLLAADPDADQFLRRALSLYRYEWPVALGAGLVAALDLTPPCTLVVGREGWSGAVLRSPLDGTLASVLEILSRTDVQETLPRHAWNGRRPERASPASRPALLADGLAPGEDEPFPAEFTQAVAAFRAKRYLQALRLIESLAQRSDGWLLPPEARYDRALCLRASGERAQAQRLLLGIGDSRFQEAVDHALEESAQPPERSLEEGERQ